MVAFPSYTTFAWSHTPRAVISVAYVNQKEEQFDHLMWHFLPTRIFMNLPLLRKDIHETETEIGDYKFTAKLGEGMLAKVRQWEVSGPTGANHSVGYVVLLMLEEWLLLSASV